MEHQHTIREYAAERNDNEYRRKKNEKSIELTNFQGGDFIHVAE